MKIINLIIVLSLFCHAALVNAYLTPQDIKQLPFKPAEYRLTYGKDPNEFGDLRLPKDIKGPYPVLVIIHGGCWMSKIATLDIMSAFAEKFTRQGFATWNIEYRSIDNPGGGWRGTFLDILHAIHYLEKIAPQYHLDLQNVIVIGHSAGGHLALWAAGSKQLKIPLKGVIDLAGPGNLRAFMQKQESVCGEKVVNHLLGDDPEKMTERLQQTSPYEMLPLGIKQILMTGDHDAAVDPEQGNAYVKSAKEKGDDAKFILVPNAGHFEVIAPESAAFPLIEEAVKSLINPVQQKDN